MALCQFGFSFDKMKQAFIHFLKSNCVYYFEQFFKTFVVKIEDVVKKLGELPDQFFYPFNRNKKDLCFFFGHYPHFACIFMYASEERHNATLAGLDII